MVGYGPHGAPAAIAWRELDAICAESGPDGRSSATPPGPSVHGMCGYHAARAAPAGLDRGRAGR